MGAGTVSGMSIQKTVIVANPPDGLHLRPATAFARLARTFRCSITVKNGDKTADGRSPHELIMLLAFPGTTLNLEFDGEDAAAASEPLLAILSAEHEDQPEAG
jgi:phosphotransferase system HPr (HPr) family protein